MDYYYCKYCNKNIIIKKGESLRCAECGYFLISPSIPVHEIVKRKIKLTTFCSNCNKIVQSIPIIIMIQAISQRTKLELKNLKNNGFLINGRKITKDEKNEIINTILDKLKSALDYLFKIEKQFNHVCKICYNGININEESDLKNKKPLCPFCNKKIDYDSTFCKYCGAKLEENTRYIPKNIRKKVWERDNGCCAKCGRIVDLEFDHIIPFSKGGANSVQNLQLLCSRCNKKKSNKING